jgi:glyoxylase-like metal-dependent hydrolase (beta-lactamase superfamily II)
MIKNNITRLIVGPVTTNCWIYPTGDKEVAVIDPGDEADKIMFTLKNLGLVHKYILLTHGHFDHICAVPELYLAGKPKIAVHRLDADYFGSDSYDLHKISVKAAFHDASFLDVYWNDMPAADILLEEGDTIGPFTVIHLPGHTPGSVAYWDKERNVLITGDTLFANGRGRSDLPRGNEADLQASLKRLFAMDPDIKVYPGHGGGTTIGREKNN